MPFSSFVDWKGSERWRRILQGRAKRSFHARSYLPKTWAVQYRQIDEETGVI